MLEIEHEMGVRAAEELPAPRARDLPDPAALYWVVPWAAKGSVVGRTLRDFGLSERYEIEVIGVRPVREKRTNCSFPPVPT